MEGPRLQAPEVSHAKPSGDEGPVVMALLRIQASPLRAWRGHLQVTFHDGALVLSGHLPSFYLKQVLQTIMRGLPGVERVENQVRVGRIPLP